jgi:4-hydroxy-tetrahydrodipicolinate synthase
VEAAAGRVAVTAHVGRASTRATARLAAEAVAVGADAVSAVTPWYYALDDDQLLAHYRALRDAVPGVPVYAYSIPRFAGNEISVGLAEALAAEGLAGLKDSSGSTDRLREYLGVVARRRAGRDFALLAGSEPLVLGALEGGAAGCVLGLANLRPDLVRALRAAAMERRSADAAALQEEIARIDGELGRGPTFTGLGRAVAERLTAGGIEYPADQRGPLGPAPARVAAASP